MKRGELSIRAQLSNQEAGDSKAATPTATPTMNPRTLAVMNEAAVKIATATRNQNLAVMRSIVSMFFIHTLYQMKMIIRPAGNDHAEYTNRPASFDTLDSLA